MAYRSRITSYRPLPPKWQIIYPRDCANSSAERYLQELDVSLESGQSKLVPEITGDIVSLVFANQLLSRQSTSYQLASLIHERRGLAQKHLSDLQWRLDALLARRPLRRGYGGIPAQQEKLSSDLERQILDLERQKREVQLNLWRDTLELRQSVVSERQEYGETRRRMHYLAGNVSTRETRNNEGVVADGAD